ncbi:MAG TPA: hypothetical protein PKA55_15100 [Rhodoblastus sp.]|nr:hypothetical protein [Rhodoblastus sp.]
MRMLIFASILVAAGPALAATIAKPVDLSQCSRDLASVDRSFAAAMMDLQRNGDAANRCSAWRRHIDVMQKASAVFSRCTAADARDGAVSQMKGSIADFEAMISQAQCP